MKMAHATKMNRAAKTMGSDTSSPTAHPESIGGNPNANAGGCVSTNVVCDACQTCDPGLGCTGAVEGNDHEQDARERKETSHIGLPGSVHEPGGCTPRRCSGWP